MNIEIQKYYTDNESRINFIDGEIESMIEITSINKTYEAYDETFKREVLQYMLERDIINSSIINQYIFNTKHNTLIELLLNIIEVNCPFCGEWEDTKSEFSNMQKTLINKKHIESLSNFEKIISTSYTSLSRILYNNECDRGYKLSVGIEGKIKELLEEIRIYKRHIVEKNAQYLPKIKSLKKEKQLLIKVNKQLKIDYKGEIVV